MSTLYKRRKEGAFRELVAKGTDFSHAQIGQEVLEFEDVVEELRFSESY